MMPTDDDGAPPPQPENESPPTPPQAAPQAARTAPEAPRTHEPATQRSAGESEYFFMDPETIEELSKQNRGTPLSDFLGMPVLSNRKPKAQLFQSDAKVSFGFKLLSSGPAPLSSMLGLPLLKTSTGKTASMGMPLLSDNPAPLSSKIGLPLLKQSKPKANLSSGTISSKVGVKTLSGSKD